MHFQDLNQKIIRDESRVNDTCLSFHMMPEMVCLIFSHDIVVDFLDFVLQMTLPITHFVQLSLHNRSLRVQEEVVFYSITAGFWNCFKLAPTTVLDCGYFIRTVLCSMVCCCYES